MAISFKNILSWFKEHYDKVIAILVLVFLLGSLLYLAVMVGTIHSDRKAFKKEIGGYKPRCPDVDDLDTKGFSEAMKTLEDPRKLANEQWTNRMMFVPEKRVCCIGCWIPIPYNAMKCPKPPFCGAEQPKPEVVADRDSDKDGMPDEWERKNGLDFQDPDDADKDADNDEFTNLEEYRAVPKTDPNDPKSHPSITAKLRVISIDRDPFKLRFKSVYTNPDRTLTFDLNLRDGSKTYFAKLGETIKGEGFTVLKYEPRTEKKKIEGIPGLRDVDVSVLTLQRGEKLIPLVKNQDVQWNEFTAQLLFTPDDSRYTVKVDQVINLKNEKFKVINIDSGKESVLLESVNDGQKISIAKFSENKRENTEDMKTENDVKPVEKQGEDPK